MGIAVHSKGECKVGHPSDAIRTISHPRSSRNHDFSETAGLQRDFQQIVRGTVNRGAARAQVQLSRKEPTTDCSESLISASDSMNPRRNSKHWQLPLITTIIGFAVHGFPVLRVFAGALRRILTA